MGPEHLDLSSEERRKELLTFPILSVPFPPRLRRYPVQYSLVSDLVQCETMRVQTYLIVDTSFEVSGTSVMP